MSAIPWAKVHGATTHFPVALTMVAFACDLVAVLFWSRRWSQGLRGTGAYAIFFAALGTVTAVGSGVVLTRGELWGDGDLGRHHRFVWPAFALIVATATWRWFTGTKLTRGSYAGYVAVGLAGAVLVGAAAYFGGEMLQGVPG